MTPSPSRTALVVAHPGHEMRLHAWLMSVRPLVFVLTDGSGRAGRSRLNSTTLFLHAAHLESGSIYGRFTDLTVYRAVLEQDFRLFTDLAYELSQAFLSQGVEQVVGDAIEGYNSTHDICRLVIDTAVEIARRSSGREIVNYDFPVVGWPDDCPEELQARAIWLQLDEQALARKLAAALTYYPELVAESSVAYSGSGSGPWQDFLNFTAGTSAAHYRGLEVFRTECLRPAGGRERHRFFASHPPYYELHGERAVAAGFYDRVIRYREHIAPLAEALWERVERRARCAP